MTIEHFLEGEKKRKHQRDFTTDRVGKSPLLAKFFPVILTIHWASLSCRALSSSALAHCLRLPAWPCPSPTKTSRSSKQRTFARITADESLRRSRPVAMPSSLEDSGLPLLKPKLFYYRTIYFTFKVRSNPKEKEYLPCPGPPHLQSLIVGSLFPPPSPE